MKSRLTPLLLSVLLGSCALVAMAQPTGQPGQKFASAMGHHGRMDAGAMQERMARHQAELKASLNLSPTQEGAWASYVAAMQPAPEMVSRMSRENRMRMHEEMQSLTTPERIDRMNAMKAQRDAHWATRAEATKAFYAILSPEQQKVFDANAMGGRQGMRHHGGGSGKRGHHG